MSEERSCAYCGKTVSEEQEVCYGKTLSDECEGTWVMPACEHIECCDKILDSILPRPDGEKR